MRSVGIEPTTSWMDERVKENKMWRVGIEPTTSWMDERVMRKIK